MSSVKNLRSHWEEKSSAGFRDYDGTLHTATETVNSNSKSSGELSREEMVEMFNASAPDLAMSFHGDEDEELTSPRAFSKKNYRSFSLDDANWTQPRRKTDTGRRVLRVSATDLGLDKGNLSAKEVQKAVKKWKADSSLTKPSKAPVQIQPKTPKTSRSRSKSPGKPSNKKSIVNRRGRSKSRSRSPENGIAKSTKRDGQEIKKKNQRIQLPKDGQKISESFDNIEKNPNLERLFNSATLDFDYNFDEEEVTVYTKGTVATSKTTATRGRRRSSSVVNRTEGGRRRASLSHIPEKSDGRHGTFKPKRRGSSDKSEAPSRRRSNSPTRRRSGSLVKRRSRRNITKTSMHEILQEEAPQKSPKARSQKKLQASSPKKESPQAETSSPTRKSSEQRSLGSGESKKSKIRMSRSKSPARHRRASTGDSPSPKKTPEAGRRSTLSPSSSPDKFAEGIYAPFSESILCSDSLTLSPSRAPVVRMDSPRESSPTDDSVKSARGRSITNIFKDIVKTPKGKSRKSVKVSPKKTSPTNGKTIEERILDAGVTPDMYEKLLASGLMIVPSDR